MKKDILATFHHLTSNDRDHNYLYCPEGDKSWYFYQNNKARNVAIRSYQKMKVRLNLNDEQKNPFLQIFEELSQDELLLKCLKCRTQSLSESFNGKIWAKCPKVRLHGKDWVTCTYITAAEHHVGYQLSFLAPNIRGNISAGLKSFQTKEKLRKKISIGGPRKKNKAESSESTYKAGAF